MLPIDIHNQAKNPGESTRGKLVIHEDCTPGLIMGGVVFELCPNHGRPCWKAIAQIETIFGSEVEGELVGIGKTKQIALERLAEEKRKLHESLFA